MPKAEPTTSGPQRSPLERQLNVGLMVVMVAALVLVVSGVVFIAQGWDGGGDYSRFETLQIGFTVLLLPGTVVFFVARSARRRLREQVVSARLFSIIAGACSILAGLTVLPSVGAISAVAGLFTLTAALLLKKETLR